MGVKVICYNFMFVFDWLRIDFVKKFFDGFEVMEYNYDMFKNFMLDEFVKSMERGF